MRKQLNIRRGLDLHLAGGIEPEGMQIQGVPPTKIAITPDDFPGFMPKTEVREGDTVEPGSPLLRDKTIDAVKLVSPVSGTVKAVVRGLRRMIERIEIEVSKPTDTKIKITEQITDGPSVKAALQRYGLWCMMRQRPYDIIPQDTKEPRDIFVTAVDTSPLAMMPSISGMDKNVLAAGVKALKMLTCGNVYLSVGVYDKDVSIDGAVMVDVSGPHPAGNPGIQAANIAPVNKGESIWTLDVITLYRIGQMIAKGYIDMTTTVAITGSEVKKPRLINTIIGADLKSILTDELPADTTHLRIIAGNVLTGIKTSIDGYLHFPYRQVTVIPEGDNADEFMGWASMSPRKMSESRSMPGHFLHRLFRPDARINGGRRAMIMSGLYDKVLPMDILPEYLFKAINANDIDRMEQLGIYEIAPEDVALCEYIDPSKLELQKLVRNGLEYLRREEA